MQVVRLKIENFRGIRSAELLFDGHTLIVARNNVGKSTICEALELVLGPDRLNRVPSIDEFDFYNARYLFPAAVEGESPVPIQLRIEAVLIEPGDEVLMKCSGHIEYWHTREKRLLGPGEAAINHAPHVLPCLRMETRGAYDLDEDEFVARTYFSHSPDAEEGELKTVPRPIKRLFGFLYLRALRTGTRALSLERGSLLDVILRAKGIRTSLWEKSIQRLRALDLEDDAAEITPVLRDIEERLSRYIPMGANGHATKLHVSELTRDHLRKTMAFFLALSSDQDHVPFAHAGTGTLNTLVLALLTVIAEMKPESVIFAMEEPEIAVPPHTQRRIAHYLLEKTTQAFVTSHSPFVIERFEPSSTLILTRDDGVITGRKVSEASGLTDKEFKQYTRWGLCECMLGKAAIVVEGLTEFHALPVAARRMEEAGLGFRPLDISGATFFYAYGESNVPKFGKFFKTLGLKTFAFYDLVDNRQQAQLDALAEHYDINTEHVHRGFEDLVSQEMPAERLWLFLSALRESGEGARIGIPFQRPDEAAVRSLARGALKSSKGAGWAARLFEECEFGELPGSVTNFLSQVFMAMLDPVPPANGGHGQAADGVGEGQ
ncbi:ATP-dependent nuclease [Herbaspirillum huttiense]|uniref:ATP-dependent nuclease n=1 Tax=Herbaspirillum huttiense TaxID=863372 RepID=UPI0031E474C9